MIAKIAIRGCDDTTRIEMNVDENELGFLKRLVTASQKISKSECQPIVLVNDDEEDACTFHKVED